MRRRAHLLTLGLALLLAACDGMLGTRPPVEDSLMVDVLASLHVEKESDEPFTPARRDSVLGAHGVAVIDYLEAVQFYAEHPARFSDLYEHVLDELSERRARVDTDTAGDRPPELKDMR